MENTTLYYREGSSDKIYQAAVEATEGGYVVTFAYGRRGTTLQTGSKTTAPVEYDRARAIYDKLIRLKTSKGYTPGESGTPYQQSANSERDSTVRCQLLNSIEETELPPLLSGFSHWMQQKIDGVRILLWKQGNRVQAINRLGLFVGLPSPVAADCLRCERDFLLDGEMVGGTFHAFDLLEIGSDNLRGKGFGERYLCLLNLLESFVHPTMQMVETAVLPKAKQELFNRLRLEEQEGVVFKEINAPYAPGRPATGNAQLKYKFVATASFIVSAINTKRSVGLSLHNENNQPVFVGNVTIAPGVVIPAAGVIVEVRYLYAFRGGSIYQPVYLGSRDDLTSADCTVDQLKYKAEPAAA